MSKMSATLLVAALVIVLVLAAALFIRAATVQTSEAEVPAPGQTLNLVSEQASPASKSVSTSHYISEKQLQRYIDHIANDHRWNDEGRMWLRIWNMRHEARCCGFPR